MGLLVQGKWQDRWYETKQSGGRFERKASSFRDQVSADGASGFLAEPGRYHLYVSLACPWAHRALIVRRLKQLEEVISLAVVDPLMGERGWVFSDAPGAADSVNGATQLYEVYLKARPDYTGRVTVPVLWDRQRQTIVNNESSEIIRIFNSAFDAWGDASVDLYPEPLRAAIDEVNAEVYERVNNGVYKAGFATTQQAYEEAVTALFAALDELEARLGQQRYLVGDQITEADWRLFTTLVRFDPVYHGHFKCNLRRLADYPNLWGFTRELYQVPGVAETVDLDQIKRHYYWSHTSINPSQVVPLGPQLDFSAPHGRG
jgi:glutathionyl-hydroquinone reductase